MILQGAMRKLFKIREDAAKRSRPKGADDGYDPDEKPFLDHLEDLRKMFFQIIIALLVGLIVAFAFNKQLIEAIKLPMIWAKIGDGEAIEILISKDKEPTPRFEGGERIVTRGGLIADVVQEDLANRTTTIEVADDIQVSIRTNEIIGIFNKVGEDADLSEAPQITKRNFLVMEAFAPHEGLTLTLKIAFFGGLIISLPFIMFFIAQFVIPGLRQSEKKVLYPALAIGFVLFLVGATFAFRVGLPFALRFLADFTLERGIEPGWRIGYYVKFITQVTVVFGIAFELPVAVIALVSMELLTYRTMRDSRAYAIVILLCLAALLTPPDPMTLGLLGGPLIILYEMCIWIAWGMERKRRKQEAEEERLRAEARARRQEEIAKLPPPEERTEEQKRLAAAEEIERYEESAPDNSDPHAGLDEYHDPYHDEHGHYIGDEHHPHDDPYHHDPHHHDHHHGHGAVGGVIDINNASLEELQTLPGVGPKLAERIIEARPYYSEDELEYHAHLPQNVIKLILDRIYYG